MKKLTEQNIKDLFPLEVVITEKIIKKSNTYMATNCIGVNALRSVLPKKLHDNIVWGMNQGHIIPLDEKAILLKSTYRNRHRVDMMECKPGTTVVFKLKK